MLLATVFVSGAAVLVVEIAGARVVSPLFGSGLYSWSALISVTLAALSLGYWGGGRLADRRPEPALFHGGILVAGLIVSALPAYAGAMLRVTEPFDSRVGVLLAATILFFPPLAVLGGVTPFAIRLARPPAGEVGATSGVVFAVSTVGSLLAALATGFVLIPNLGVRTILTLTGVVLLLTSAVGLLLAGRRGPASVAGVLMALALVSGRAAGTAAAGPELRVLARVPSFFGYLRVVENRTRRLLTVNGIGQNYVPLDPGAKPYEYLQFMSAVPKLARPGIERPTGLLIGLGAGELVRMLGSEGLELTVVELDPRIDELARRHFGLVLPRERIHLEDGRAFLERDRHRYDFVFMDAFLGEDVPGHLYTREAFAAVKRRLSPGGVLAMNYTTVVNGRDAAAVARTLREVFADVRAFTDGSPPADLASMVLLASDAPLRLDPAAATPGSGEATFVANETRLDLGRAIVLTDDFNPIQSYRLGANRLWRRAMIQYVGDDWSYWGDF